MRRCAPRSPRSPVNTCAAAPGRRCGGHAERGFRDLKSTLELRPVFHRLEPRIRAHVLLCWFALLLVRVEERRCGTTWRHIATELGRVHAVTLTGTAGTVIQTTHPSDTAAGFLAACQVDPLPRITHLDPA